MERAAEERAAAVSATEEATAVERGPGARDEGSVEEEGATVAAEEMERVAAGRAIAKRAVMETVVAEGGAEVRAAGLAAAAAGLLRVSAAAGLPLAPRPHRSHHYYRR